MRQYVERILLARAGSLFDIDLSTAANDPRPTALCSVVRRRHDVLLIAWIGQGSHGFRDVGKGASGRVSREIETMG